MTSLTSNFNKFAKDFEKGFEKFSEKAVSALPEIDTMIQGPNIGEEFGNSTSGAMINSRGDRDQKISNLRSQQQIQQSLTQQQQQQGLSSMTTSSQQSKQYQQSPYQSQNPYGRRATGGLGQGNSLRGSTTLRGPMTNRAGLINQDQNESSDRDNNAIVSDSNTDDRSRLIVNGQSMGSGAMSSTVSSMSALQVLGGGLGSLTKTLNFNKGGTRGSAGGSSGGSTVTGSSLSSTISGTRSSGSSSMNHNDNLTSNDSVRDHQTDYNNKDNPLSSEGGNTTIGKQQLSSRNTTTLKSGMGEQNLQQAQDQSQQSTTNTLLSNMSIFGSGGGSDGLTSGTGSRLSDLSNSLNFQNLSTNLSSSTVGNQIGSIQENLKLGKFSEFAKKEWGKAKSNLSTTRETFADGLAKTKQDLWKDINLGEKANRFQDGIKSGAQRAKESALTVGDKMKNMKEGVQNMTVSRGQMMNFFIVFGMGFAIMGLSLSFLPTIILAPQKFGMLFGLGSLLMLSSFAVLRGPRPFLNHIIAPESSSSESTGSATSDGNLNSTSSTILSKLTRRFSNPRLLYAIAYSISFLIVWWAALFHPPFAYIWILVFGCVQASSLLYFLFSYLPGGQRMLTFMGRTVRKICTGIFSKAMKGVSG